LRISKKSSTFVLDMQKRTYYIPTIEVIPLESGILMQEWLAGSGEHGSVPAPQRSGNKVF